MTNRTYINTERHFTSRVHRQHNSLVVTVPKELCEVLKIQHGDILVFEHSGTANNAIFGKLPFGSLCDGRD